MKEPNMVRAIKRVVELFPGTVSDSGKSISVQFIARNFHNRRENNHRCMNIWKWDITTSYLLLPWLNILLSDHQISHSISNLITKDVSFKWSLLISIETTISIYHQVEKLCFKIIQMHWYIWILQKANYKLAQMNKCIVLPLWF